MSKRHCIFTKNFAIFSLNAGITKNVPGIQIQEDHLLEMIQMKHLIVTTIALDFK